MLRLLVTVNVVLPVADPEALLPKKIADMVVVPAAVAVTWPGGPGVPDEAGIQPEHATSISDDCHIASLVTSCVLPSV
ncbi:MAG: hypothetical protein ACYC3O_11005 [Burkholderiales bacterium]